MKKPNLNLKDFDYKQFFIQKGEKVALWVAVGIMSLMLIFSGLTAVTGNTSPSENADRLAKLSSAAESAMKTNPTEEQKKTLSQLPDDLKQAEQPRPLDPSDFPTPNMYFQPSSVEDVKWRAPKVLTPDEFAMNYVRGAVQSNIVSIDDNGDVTFEFIERKQRSKDTDEAIKALVKQLKMKVRNFQRRPQMPPGGLGGRPGFGGPGGGFPGGKGGTGMGNGGRPGQPGPSGPSGPGIGQDPGADGGEDVSLKKVKAEDLDKISGPLAETLEPVRMVVVTGAFPFKSQVEEFRHALRFGSVAELLAEERPEFVGLDIQRREVFPRTTEWADLDVDAYRRLRFAAVGVVQEDDDSKNYEIIPNPNKLVMPRPLLARDQAYPDVELKGIKDALVAIKKARGNDVVASEPRKVRYGDLDIFGSEDSVRQRSGPGNLGKNPANPSTGPGGGALTPPGLIPPGGNVGPGGPQGGNRPNIGPKGGKGGMRDGGSAFNPRPSGPPQGANPSAPSTLSPSQDGVVPDKVLLRFIDVTVQPGHAYEYQVRVKMVNPAHLKPERAVDKEVAELEFVRGEWQGISVNDEKAIQIPPDRLFFAVDDKPEKGSVHPANQERMAVQIQRWADNVPTNPIDARTTEQPVGQWLIMDRLLVNRGEYIGRYEEVEVPVWSPTQAKMVFALHPDDLKRKGHQIRFKHKGIPVDFRTDSLLVDFDGGKREVTVNGKKITDDGPIEMLTLSPDGKRLVLHNSFEDTDNKDREERRSNWKKELEDVRSQADNKSRDSGGNDNLFLRRGGR